MTLADDTKALATEMVETRRALESLVAELQKVRSGPSGAGIAGGGGVSGAAVAGSPAANTGQFWNPGGGSLSGSLSGAGSALGPMRQFLASSGIPGAGLAMSALAGPAAAATGLGALGGQVLKDSISPTLAGFNTYTDSLKSGAFESEEFVSKRAKLRARIAEIDAGDNATNKAVAFLMAAREKPDDPEAGAKGVVRFLEGVARQHRRATQNLEHFEWTEHDLESRMDHFFGRYAQFGVRPTQDQYLSVANLFKKQSETSFLIQADIKSVASRLMAGQPGTQGQQGKQ